MESLGNIKQKVTLFSLQVGGILPKLITDNHAIIMKKLNSQQLFFYQYMNSLSIADPSYHLYTFLPKYRGVISSSDIDLILEDCIHDKNQPANEWIQWKKTLLLSNTHQSYLKLENFAFKITRPNIMDVKLGYKRDRLDHTKTLKKNIHSFDMHGFRINFDPSSNYQTQPQSIKGKTIFLSKYSFESLNQSQEVIFSHLALFFFDGQHIRIKVLRKIIEKLRELILSVKCLHSWKLTSTSVCVYYESVGEGFVGLKLVDFQRSIFTGSYQADEVGLIEGLDNLHRFLVKVVAMHQEVELANRCKVLAKKYVQEKLELVSERRRVKQKGFQKEKK